MLPFTGIWHGASHVSRSGSTHGQVSLCSQLSHSSLGSAPSFALVSRESAHETYDPWAAASQATWSVTRVGWISSPMISHLARTRRGRRPRYTVRKADTKRIGRARKHARQKGEQAQVRERERDMG